MNYLFKIIESLCIDKHFGIYTRNYIDFLFETQYKTEKINVVIVDFKFVHHMNRIFGYKKVNDVFRGMFSTFVPPYDVTIGRWFSGDEIVLITEHNPCCLIEDFQEHCAEFNLHFRVINISNHISNENINKIEVV